MNLQPKTPTEILKECTGHSYGLTDAMHIKAMKLYATEKVKEALKLAAERAYIEYVPSKIPYGGEDVTVDKDSILSLETELIERINKEK